MKLAVYESWVGLWCKSSQNFAKLANDFYNSSPRPCPSSTLAAAELQQLMFHDRSQNMLSEQVFIYTK